MAGRWSPLYRRVWNRSALFSYFKACLSVECRGLKAQNEMLETSWIYSCSVLVPVMLVVWLLPATAAHQTPDIPLARSVLLKKAEKQAAGLETLYCSSGEVVHVCNVKLGVSHFAGGDVPIKGGWQNLAACPAHAWNLAVTWNSLCASWAALPGRATEPCRSGQLRTRICDQAE